MRVYDLVYLTFNKIHMDHLKKIKLFKEKSKEFDIKFIEYLYHNERYIVLREKFESFFLEKFESDLKTLPKQRGSFQKIYYLGVHGNSQLGYQLGEKELFQINFSSYYSKEKLHKIGRFESYFPDTIEILIDTNVVKKGFFGKSLIKGENFIFKPFGFIRWVFEENKPEYLSNWYYLDNNFSKRIFEEDMWFSKYLELHNLFNLEKPFLEKLDELIIFFIQLINLEFLDYKKSIENLKISKSDFIKSFDKDKNGKLDLTEIEDIFENLLVENSSVINSLEPSLVRELIKVSEFINQRKRILNSVYSNLIDSDQEFHFNDFKRLLKNHIHFYNVILISSVNMINFLKNNDLLNYNIIYSSFEKIGVFDSTWERNVLGELNSINSNLSLIFNQLKTNNYSIQGSISSLVEISKNNNKILKTELKSIQHGIGLNNLLSGIQTYQMYKINKNTKPLN